MSSQSTDPAIPTTSSARIAAAAALRDLGHAMVEHQVDDEVFVALSRQVAQITAVIAQGPDRLHGFFHPDRPVLEDLPMLVSEGRPLPALPDCVISGFANPMGVAASFFRDGDEAICRVELGPAFEGAPDRAHGGIVSAIFDHTMGLATAPTPAFTGWITVSYRAPTPLNTPLEVRARVTERDGRKLSVSAEMTVEGEVLVEGQGLFIMFDIAKVMGAASDAATP